MRSIKEYMLNEARKSNEPVIGNIAYDYNDDPWVVIDYCKVSETSKLKKLMREFDTGVFADDYKAGAYDGEAYAVAAYNRDDEREFALWIWSPDGLWPEKR